VTSKAHRARPCPASPWPRSSRPGRSLAALSASPSTPGTRPCLRLARNRLDHEAHRPGPAGHGLGRRRPTRRLRGAQVHEFGPSHTTCGGRTCVGRRVRVRQVLCDAPRRPQPTTPQLAAPSSTPTPPPPDAHVPRSYVSSGRRTRLVPVAHAPGDVYECGKFCATRRLPQSMLPVCSVSSAAESGTWFAS
jgi:hypothetical protein